MKKLVLFLFACLGILSVHAQDPQFSQYYANPLYTNPAFAGSSRYMRIVLAGRNQYTALQRNYRTASASIDGNIQSLNGGLGLIATTDVAGDGFLTTNTFNGIYSYHIPLTRNVSMRAALQAGIIQKSYDFSQFRFGDQIDERQGFIKATSERRGQELITVPNFSTGFIIYSNQIFGGVAVHNLVEPNQSFYFQNSSDEKFNLPRRYTAHAGANIYLTQERNENERTYISPNVLYMQQRNFNQFNMGFLVKKNSFTFGGWFRQTTNNSDAVIALIGVRLPKFRVGYSFDATISDARTATVGTHEITLALEIRTKKRYSSTKKQPKEIKCPDF